MKNLILAVLFLSAPAFADTGAVRNIHCSPVSGGKDAPLAVNLELTDHGGTGYIIAPFVEGHLGCATNSLDRESEEVTCSGLFMLEGAGEDRLVRVDLVMGVHEGKGTITGPMVRQIGNQPTPFRALVCR